jgi:hypothetical protein
MDVTLHRKPNREKIEPEELVKERLPLTEWALTPKEKEDFERVMWLMFDATDGFGLRHRVLFRFFIDDTFQTWPARDSFRPTGERRMSTRPFGV